MTDKSFGKVNSITTRKRILLVKLIVAQSRNPPSFMEPESSLASSKEPATGPYSEPVQPIPQLHSVSLRAILILSSHTHLGLPNCVFFLVLQTKILYVLQMYPIHATFPAHLLLDLIFVITSDKEYKL